MISSSLILSFKLLLMTYKEIQDVTRKKMQIIAANFETIDDAKLALEAIKKAYVERGHAAILSKSA